MKSWLTLADRINSINKLFAFLGRWAIIMMLGLGFWNVVGRYLGVAIGYNLTSNRLIEGQWYLFAVSFLLGLGWTLQKKEHVRVDILQTNWSKRRKAKLEIIGTLLLLLPFTLSVIIVAIEPTIQSWSISEASPDPNGLPRYWIKTAIPLGFMLLALQGISEVIQNSNTIQKSVSSHNSSIQAKKR